jgi:hypothetical protein
VPLLTLFAVSILAMPQQAVLTGPTVADTAWVHGLLQAAEEQLRGVPNRTGHRTIGRLGRAWVEWGDLPRGAALIDAASTADASIPFVLQQPLYRDWLNLGIKQYMAGDTVAARRGEAALTGEARDAFREELVGQLLRSGRLEEADSVLELINDPLRHARAVLEGTRESTWTGLTRDDVIARLQAELVRIAGLSNGDVPNVRLYIHGRLLALGVELTPADVSATLTPEQAQRNLEILADQLDARGQREEALQYLNSALLMVEGARSDMRPHVWLRSRINILNARGEPGDSTRAALLADSLALVMPPGLAPTPAMPPELETFHTVLQAAEQEGDFVAFGEHLTAMDRAGYPEESLWYAVHTGFDLWNGRYDTVPPSPDDIHEVLTTAWSLGADLEAASRDSIRLHLVTPTWVALDVDAAFAKALEIETRRFRERALARFVSRVELDELARLMADFEDAEARNRGFSRLAREYLRVGQVDLAQSAAERTVSGESRVWALALAADARRSGGDSLNARELIRAAVNEMADEALCEGHCEVIVGQGGTPAPVTTPPSLITQVIATAYVLGETDALERWAAARSDADAKARSYVKIAEVILAVHSPNPWERPRWGVWGP